MKLASFIAGTAVMLGTAAASLPAGAVELSPNASYAKQSLAEPVYYRRHWNGIYLDVGPGHSCRYWRHECAERWGWRTRPFFRCLWRHGC